MLKKTIEYVDYDGNKRKEDHYFNLTKPELMEMTFSEKGGLDNYVKKIISEQDSKKILELFKEVICMSYGEKSADGKRFIKDPELTKAFTETEAYSTLYMELFTDEKAGADFIAAIIPKDVSDEMEKHPEYKKEFLN